MTQHATARHGLDLTGLRTRLSQERGPKYWKSLEQLAETDEFLEFLYREFPRQASEWTDASSRRQFLRVMAASLALAGVTGCAYNAPDQIVPYVRAPEEMVQGKPLFFATSVLLGGYATGVLAESHEGRPTNLAGNDLHPASLGAIDVFSQAEILNLYDPDRSQSVLRNGRPSTWQDFQVAMLSQFNDRRPSGGRGVRILTGSITSPSLAHSLRKWLEELPEAKWHQYEAVGRDQARAGAILAFGEDVQTHYQIDQADVILALDCDFLASGPGFLAHARAFADRRDPDISGDTMNRLYAVEPSTTLTGAKADHRLPLRPSLIGSFTLALARELGVEGAPEPPERLADEARRWVEVVARDLQANQEKSLVTVGESQPAAVHALVHAINQTLGNVGQTLAYTEPLVAESVDQGASLKTLVDEINAGEVEMLVILGSNPVYDAPVDLNFRRALEQVPLRVHTGLYLDETGELCHWHVPLAHDLETWGDARAFDGTVSLRQPLIEPIFGGRTALQFVSALRGQPTTFLQARTLLEDYWREHLPGDVEFSNVWREYVHDGLIPDTALPSKEVTLQAVGDWIVEYPVAGPAGDVELAFAPDPTVFDGRFNNNAWLQELPKPLTKLTWDNALLVAPRMAERMGLNSGDVVSVAFQRRALDVAVWVNPGQADGVVTLHLGYGRRKAGRVGTGTGFNAYAIRTSDRPWIGSNAQLSKTNRTYLLASTQMHRSLEGRNLLREGTLAEYQANRDFVHADDHHVGGSFYPEEPNPHEGAYQWGMTIDLNRCIGCNACMISCQSENTIPTVGKDQVANGREMHWIEVDSYYSSLDPADPQQAMDNPAVSFQPRTCMHCEKAPCEVVCPVAATVHDHEGLNNMVYNRCVGTRYCSNNCPYKVRHFNFLDYNELRLSATADRSGVSPLTLQFNPDVTVRSLGVMEKCTYCVQRIYAGKIQSELEDRRVQDGDIVTACQAACPTRAIVFGDITDQDAQVKKLKDNPRNYKMLDAELNTRPRTTYLAKLRNPNPELETV